VAAQFNRPFSGLTLLVLLIGLSGCEEQKKPRLQTANGRTLGHVVGWITLDGKPLAGAQVDFHNEITRTCSGGTDQNGRYELKFNRHLRGAPVGEHQVAIGLFGHNSEDPVDEPLPEFYNKKTVLKATVVEGDNVISFHLTTPQGASEVSELGPVRGLVLLDGNPLPGAQLVFQGDGKNVARGTSDNTGFYELVFTEKREGAAVGANRITVSKMNKDGQEILRPIYNTKSTLKRVVRSGENQINLSLTTKDLPQTIPKKKPRPTVPNGS
tara:strand:+ start:821 stop:1627 length:807 start_codon:yes stop_codon:yes gene_type:complete